MYATDATVRTHCLKLRHAIGPRELSYGTNYEFKNSNFITNYREPFGSKKRGLSNIKNKSGSHTC